jgi:uncharacterized membrane protein YphA (DoxX/SURF4 family)
VDLVILILRLLLGGLLVVAGVLKIGHSVELAASIAGFRLLPAAVVGPLAIALPYLEVLLGGYLIAGLFTRIVAIVCAAQFLFYTGAIASAVLRHISATCGCFGPADTAVADWPHAGFDLLLAAACTVVAYGAPGALAFDRKLRNA